VDKATGTDYDCNAGPGRLSIIISSKERVDSLPGLRRVVEAMVPYLYMIASFEWWQSRISSTSFATIRWRIYNCGLKGATYPAFLLAIS
jgi:hypothetical protein